MPKTCLILTYNDLDGAAAAATALIARPTAQVQATSAWRISEALEAAAIHEPPYSEILVCGVGIQSEEHRVTEALGKLKTRGSSVVWISGKGEIDSIRPLLEGTCSAIFTQSGSDTAGVCSYLTIGDGQVCLLLEMVCEEEAELSPAARRLRDLVEAAMARYFKFADRNAYPTAIRKIAGFEPITADDEREIDHFRDVRARYALQGRSSAIKKVRERVRRIAEFDSTSVLIIGETGVGKEHVAHLLHEGSPRRQAPFHVLNCGTLAGMSGDLINSRLFGYAKGAFTGANESRPGLFELAHQGTLFLDEIGELPLDSQARLLRVLQDGVVTRIGDDAHEIEVDVRIVAATHRNLMARVRDGQFRLDLLYRLNTVIIDIPPLRERPQDIDILTRTLRISLESRHGRPLPELTPRDIRLLKDYAWPGNVRQLRAVLERALIFGDGDSIREALDDERRLHQELSTNPMSAPLSADSEGRQPQPLPDAPAEPRPVTPQEGQCMTLEQLQRAYARQVLGCNDGNITRTARLLGVSVNTLKRKLKTEF